LWLPAYISWRKRRDRLVPEECTDREVIEVMVPVSNSARPERLPVRFINGKNFQLSNRYAEAVMPFVTVKPKFQVTIPAKLRRGIDVREGDIMEATLVGDGILFRLKEVVDRDAAAQRIAVSFATAQPSSEDLGRTEDEIMRESIAEVTRSRRERRHGEA